MSEEQRREQVIANVIDSLEAERERLMKLNQKEVKEIAIDRVGNGIHYQITYRQGTLINRELLTSKRMRKDLLGKIRSRPHLQRDLQQVLELGIELKFIYRRHDGQKIADFTLQCGDLKKQENDVKLK